MDLKSIDERARDVLYIAETTAMERSRVAKLRSAMGTKINQWKKPGNIVKTAVSVGGSLIPIPFLSIAVDWGVAKVAATLREKSHKRKKRKYDADDNVPYEDKMKFHIKDLSIKHLAESARKVRVQIEKYNSQLPTGQMSQCHFAFQKAYRFFRGVHRTRQLWAEAEAMKALANEIIAYCITQEDALERCYPEVVAAVANAMDHDSATCRAGKGCYNGEAGAAALERDADKIRGYDLP